MTVIAKRPGAAIGRPLKVLIPLIQRDLELGDRAGIEHYADAGDKLLESKPQVAHGAWGRWLGKNFGGQFNLSITTAQRYMRLARLRADQGQNHHGVVDLPRSINEMEGTTARARAHRAAARPFRDALRDIAPDLYAQEKQTRDDEVKLHRDLAEELIDIGYKALAIRLHPDKGGSRDAMRRLNTVREELKSIAATRRFV